MIILWLVVMERMILPHPKLVMEVCMLVISSRKHWLVGLVQWTAIPT
jgi:hypothetical protein